MVTKPYDNTRGLRIKQSDGKYVRFLYARPLLFCLKSERSVCYSVPDNTGHPTNDYYRDGYNLFLRMEKYMQNDLLFLHNSRVPATNNEAERLLRNYKRKQAQAVTFQSFRKYRLSLPMHEHACFDALEDSANILTECPRYLDKENRWL